MNTTVPRWVRTAGAASVALVAAVAAVVSYSHMYLLATRAGEGWRAWLEPLSVDGLLVGASLILYVRRRSSWLTWTSLSVGLLVSLAANLAAAQPELVSRLVAAWPAAALALSYETLLTLVRQAGDQPLSWRQESGDVTDVGKVSGLVERARDLVTAGEVDGKPIGRGTLARELEIPEHQARQLLATLRNGQVNHD